MLTQHCTHRNGGWGGGRRDSLAELGITEEEFEEYAQRKPRRGDSDNAEADTLAMGMDVDLNRPQQAARRGSRPLEDSSSDEEPTRAKRRDRCGAASKLWELIVVNICLNTLNWQLREQHVAGRMPARMQNESARQVHTCLAPIFGVGKQTRALEG